MNEEIKAALEAVKKATHDFREANDRALAQKADKGYVDGELQAKVAKLNADIDAAQANLKERMDALERRVNRDGQFGDAGEQRELAKAARQFGRVLTAGNPSLRAEFSAEWYAAYKQGLVSYIRRGENALLPEERAALSVGSDPNGGYWVTPDLGGRIAKLVYETSPMRQICAVQAISSDALEGGNDLDESAGAWVAEAAARSDSTTPQIGSWRIPVHEVYAQPKATQKLLDDASVDVEAWLAEKAADKLSRLENTAFCTGSGVGQPMGLTKHASGVPAAGTNWKKVEQVNSGASGAFAASAPGDKLIDLIFKLKAAYRQGARFLMPRAVLAEVRKLKDGQSNYLWQPDFSKDRSGTLIGYPITEAEDMPALAANSLSLAFGDFSRAYQIVDHAAGLRVLRDPFTDKPNIRFYTTRRVGGDVHNFEALKLMKFAA